MRDEWSDETILNMIGVIPAGQIFGMPVFIDPRLPRDRIRFVDPVTGTYSDFQMQKP